MCSSDLYHEIPVLYACMRIKEMDSVLTEAENYRNQFEAQKKWFVTSYSVPPSLRDDRLSQRFTATAGQQAFVITKETYFPSKSNLFIYVTPASTITSTSAGTAQKTVSYTKVSSTVKNYTLISTTTTTTNDPNGFILSYACSAGDVVTAVWEEHYDAQNPPYPWWSGQGW